MSSAPAENLLIIGDSESNADLYYTTRFFVTISVIYLEIGGRKILLLNDLEYGRGKTEAQVDEIVSTTPYEERLRAAREQVRPTSILDLFLQERGVRELTVPAGLGVGHAERLREKGYVLKVREEPFFPNRTQKSPAEVALIEKTQASTEAAMDLAISILRQCDIRGDWLYHAGAPLSSERLRLEIHKFLLEQECVAANTIVAGGDQGADPHHRGSGPLPAHQTIILDIFPQSSRTRYWGDMTRTVVRGKASTAVKKLHRDVLDAQELAFSLIKEGADGQQVHEEVSRHFRDRGNPNEDKGSKKTGYIHSTGHGIGLEIHEYPKIGKVEAKLKSGQVLTVEPGLYYPGVGAVRIEDIVVVENGGCRNLNRYPKFIEV